MWPMITGGTLIGGLALWLWKRKHDPSQLPPALVDQGVTDPTTGKTIVTLADESQAFVNVQKATPFESTGKALYTHLKANGYDESAGLASLVEAFQKASNQVLLGTFFRYGQLPEDGVFGITTAYALGQLTGDPLPADPAAPRPPLHVFGDTINVNAASLTEDAGWLVMRYIDLNGDHPTDPVQMVLTKQLQVAYNTDPAYPGPGWTLSAQKPTATKLAEDGKLGPATKAILYKDMKQSDFKYNPDGSFGI